MAHLKAKRDPYQEPIYCRELNLMLRNSHKTAEQRERAEVAFKRKEAHRIDAPKAMREYRDAQQTTRDRMMKLRAERLARDS